MHALCNTKKSLTAYAGCLTWNPALRGWVLPTYHPSVVQQAKYDEYDFLYDHLKRAVDLLNGTLEFPDHSAKLDFEFVGHNGVQQQDKTWSGYFEATEREVSRASKILTKWSNQLAQGPVVFGLDTETFNTEWGTPLTMVQVYDGDKGYAFNFEVLKRVENQFKAFLINRKATFVLHNVKFDAQVLYHHFGVWLRRRNVEDTMCYGLGLSENGRKVGLKYLSRQYLNAPFYEEELDIWLDRSDNGANINYGHIRPDVLAEYGCKDVYYTHRLLPVLSKMVQREGTEWVVKNTLIPAQLAFASIEYSGIHVDVPFAQQTSADWGPRIDQAIGAMQEYAREHGFPIDPTVVDSQTYRDFCECVPVRLQFHLAGKRCMSFAKILREEHGFNPPCAVCSNKRYIKKADATLNISSPKQLQHLCFDILNMNESYKGRSCAKEFWAENQGHPFAELMKDYKQLYYIRRDFLDGIQKFVGKDGNIHPDFLLFGTKTGRLAIHKPAMQTVPAHGSNAKAAKRVIIPSDSGDCIVNVDYKALEMYINHHLTQDDVLLEHLESEHGIYRMFAGNVLGKEPSEVTADERQVFKQVVLSAGYGIGGKKLVKVPAIKEYCGGNPAKAQDLINGFWETYENWAMQAEDWRAQAINNQKIRTEMGRVRRWNLITPDNEWSVRNQAINFSGQSMGSDLCLHSLMKLQRKLPALGWGRVLLTVHDSIVFEIKKIDVHRAVRLINKVMTKPPFESTTPFQVDIEVGPSYGVLSPYDKEFDYRTLPSLEV